MERTGFFKMLNLARRLKASGITKVNREFTLRGYGTGFLTGWFSGRLELIEVL